jgi:hypothetical protein
MKILDGNRTIEVPDDDPVVQQIRALLAQPSQPVPTQPAPAQPAVDHPIRLLWTRASGPLREVLVAIAEHGGDISQVDLEKILGVDGIGLRGRTAGLGRIAVNLAVAYPIRQTGGRREFRHFFLEPIAVKEVLQLAEHL